MEKKRKGGAEKLRVKKRLALQGDAAKCQKLTSVFPAAGSPPLSAASTAAPVAALVSLSVSGGDAAQVRRL